MPDIIEVTAYTEGIVHTREWKRFSDFNKIKIKIIGLGGLKDIQFLLRPYVPFWKVKQAYADVYGLKPESLTFVHNEIFIDDHFSPSGLYMQSGDEITVFRHVI